MKIRRIRLENINSLRGEHEISFTEGPLFNSRLFAITGPTGSGKSTVLDVITLALFNQIPRLSSKITKNLILSTGAILTQNTKRALAEVEYECANGIFISRWSIEYNRNDNLKDYEMEIASLGGELLPLKKSEVPEKNQELIGLSYEQFVKSILLAQGAFAEFLKARKSERGELLEKITGTGIYRQLGIKAFERKKEFAEKLENLHQRKQEWEEQNPTDEKIAETKAAKALLQKEIQKLEKQLDEVSRKQENKRSIVDLSAKYSMHEESFKRSHSKLTEYDEKFGKRLAEHERTLSFSAELQELIQLERECKRLDDEVLLEENKTKDLNDAKTKLLHSVELLIGKEPEENKVREQLKEFESNVKSIQEERRELLRKYDFEKERLEEKLPETASKEKIDLKGLHAELTNKTIEAKSEIAQLHSALDLQEADDLETIKERLEKESKSVYSAHGDYQTYNDRLKQKEKEEQNLLAVSNRLDALPTQLTESEEVIKEYTHKVENVELRLENYRLVAELEEYRHKLNEGEACPLCGSKEHPLGLHVPESGELQKLEKELHEAKNKKSIAEKSALQLKESIQTAEAEKKRFEQNIKEYASVIDQKKSELDAVYPKWNEVENWESLKIDFDKRLEGVKRLQKHISNVENYENAIRIAEKMDEISEQGQRIRSKLNEIYSGSDIEGDVDRLAGRLQTNQESIRSNQERIENFRSQLKALDVEFTKRSEKLDQWAKDSGFEDLQSARSARMREEEYAKLKKGRDLLDKEVTDSQTKMATLEKTLTDLKSVFSTEETLDELNEKHQEIKEALIEKRAEMANLDSVLNTRKQCAEQIARLQREIQQEGKTARKWQLLNTMIGDAKGSKFNQFAQDLTLDQLLILGNQRLKGLSDRYRMARPKGEEDEALVIIDNHMAGMRRSVRTLSGGETFLMSLSLALALSDMASRKIEINSLFVDEGFGTLDPETLDQTLDTLEKLQAEGDKTIGIISHVDALKERISTQIQLERNSLGNSSMRIVG
jgi:exonuclease SbcC